MTILIVPGLGGSGPSHWQSAWERLDPLCRRVEQADWDHPDRSAWCACLDAAVRSASPAGPVVLVAHSLGCATVAHWAAVAPPERTRAVKGALLVAPADVEGCALLAATRSFAPLPRVRLPFASILVASRDDPYASFGFAASLAQAWGAELVDVGALGHVNADSNLGDWSAGRALLARLR